ncbi:putative metal-dependent hydrolase [Ichthyenterobacterium sp. W332]|uniref:Metal-dependent hydrolase n=1 Tax=Microcosmobacter mediterraneus TaxID=3075607 RepID=A0ABU2YMC1_9FLAO|nr:putative metal-dependent hydrolase [Ichthyenterobacterium sp. W332]MDT0559310.1 putative metal-dependent hydrolase [Ichthyenterobacterium sp. W332]
MSPEELEQLKFPVGTFQKPNTITQDYIEECINTIEAFPQNIKDQINGLDLNALNYKYRPNGWNIKQVVHHCADSHMNSIIRFKLALTENTPTIRPYYEDRWATLIDGNDNNLENSLHILTGVHGKLGKLLRNISKEDLKREFVHPEHGKHFSLEETIGIYAWHSNHHLAHIKQALKFKGAFN